MKDELYFIHHSSLRIHHFFLIPVYPVNRLSSKTKAPAPIPSRGDVGTGALALLVKDVGTLADEQLILRVGLVNLFWRGGYEHFQTAPHPRHNRRDLSRRADDA